MNEPDNPRRLFKRILTAAQHAGAQVLLDQTNSCLAVRGPSRKRLAERLETAMDRARAAGLVVVVNLVDFPPVLVFLTRAEYEAAKGDLRQALGSRGFVRLDGAIQQYDPVMDETVTVHDACGHGFLPTRDEYGNG
jgi:hypothetical protein